MNSLKAWKMTHQSCSSERILVISSSMDFLSASDFESALEFDAEPSGPRLCKLQLKNYKFFSSKFENVPKKP